MKYNYKKLGIIGGMGPFADSEFIQILLRCTEVNTENDYIPFMLDCNSLRPSRSDFIVCGLNPSPEKSILKSLKRLENSSCDIICMPCNTAHFWEKAIILNKNKKTEFLSMPKLCAEHLKKRNIVKISIFATDGTIKSNIYKNLLENMGIECIYPCFEKQREITKIISDVKIGKNSVEKLRNLIESEDSEVLTACTELSYIVQHFYGDFRNLHNITDPLEVLAMNVILKFNAEFKDGRFV